MNIYFSEVTLLLQCFIFLFKPIYKNIYLTIIKLDIFENRMQTACRHVCNVHVQSLYSFFKVFCGKKAAGFQSTGLH